MTLPLTPQPEVRVSGLARAQVSLCTALALILSHLPPRTIGGVLRRLCHGTRAAGFDEARRARDEVCGVSSRCASQRGCLQRSIAVMLLCRVRGCAPCWKTGYRIAPFTAHAWVEAEGYPVAEQIDLSLYVTVIEVRPTEELLFFRPVTEPEPEKEPS